MRAVDFEDQNCIFAEYQSEYLPLPAHKDADGTVTACWKLSLYERIKVVVTGKIFTQVLTFRRPLQPMKICVDKPRKGK